MTIEITTENQRLIDRVLHSGGYHNAGEVISAALSALARDVEDRTATERETAIERLKTFGKVHGLSLNGTSLRELRDEARP